ncbi:hypothetical protein KCP78_04830 [Salmonella enterica subsp. enterica]|nr:hypothetical protein KCP78_04830 [Salmonella enterica subsp. enterica]
MINGTRIRAAAVFAPTLQIEAAKRFWPERAKNVLDISVRSHMKTHKPITYPRSDCRYLPELPLLPPTGGHERD